MKKLYKFSAIVGPQLLSKGSSNWETGLHIEVEAKSFARVHPRLIRPSDRNSDRVGSEPLQTALIRTQLCNC